MGFVAWLGPQGRPGRATHRATCPALAFLLGQDFPNTQRGTQSPELCHWAASAFQPLFFRVLLSHFFSCLMGPVYLPTTSCPLLSGAPLGLPQPSPLLLHLDMALRVLWSVAVVRVRGPPRGSRPRATSVLARPPSTCSQTAFRTFFLYPGASLHFLYLSSPQNLQGCIGLTFGNFCHPGARTKQRKDQHLEVKRPRLTSSRYQVAGAGPKGHLWSVDRRAVGILLEVEPGLEDLARRAAGAFHVLCHHPACSTGHSFCPHSPS